MKRERRTEPVEEILTRYIRIKVDDRGRVYIPKPVRKRLLIKEGDVLYATLEEGGFKIRTASAIAKELKEKVTRLRV